MCSKQYAPEICQKSCASIVVDTSNETKWPTLFLVTVLLVWLVSELIIIVLVMDDFKISKLDRFRFDFLKKI